VAEKILHLLYIDDHLSETAELSKHLRRTGYVVREARAMTVAEIQHAAGEATPDIVFYGAGIKEPGLAAAKAALEDLGIQPAFIVLGYEANDTERTQWLRKGARDVVQFEDLELVGLVVERELSDVVTQRRALESGKLLEESEARCKNLLDNASEAIAFVHEGAHVYMNPAYLTLFGYQDSDELEGLPLMNLVAEAERYELRKLLKAFTRGKREVDRVSATGIRADGSSFAGEIHLQTTTIEGEPCAQVTFVDTSMPAEVEGQLAELHQRDPLTGLYNRYRFKEMLDGTHAKSLKQEGSWALLYLLLHQHGEVCAAHGLIAGDEVVRMVAGLIERSVGAEITTARFSESVFAILMPAATPEEAQSLGENLRSAIEQLVVQADSRIITTTCCIGACMVDGHSADAGEVIANANTACEEARQAGGNRVVTRGSNAETETADLSQRVSNNVEESIANGNLFFQYQPIASLKEGGGERFEACIRVRDSDDNLRTPDEAFPRAEECGLLALVDTWAVTHAVDLLREAASQGRDLTLMVKISANSLLGHHFAQSLPELVDQVPGLVLGVGVGLAEKYYRQTLDLAKALRDNGAKLALVDLDRSANAERLIGLLQPDLVRFDSGLVEKLGQDGEIQEFVDSVAEQLRIGGGEAIAGGIVHAQQLASIWQTELALIQGDFVAAPQESMSFDFEQFVA
jgi:diguanylate cyclase (GGDEF)-like protein/PAS domain S-box-containing protein